MKIKLLFFGVIGEKTGLDELEMEEMADLNMLKDALGKKFPKLLGHTVLYAVNQTVVKGNIQLKEGDEIAIMPPFAGG